MAQRPRKQKYTPEAVPMESGNQLKLRSQIKAKNTAQDLYLTSLREKKMTLGVGPAGCGKTFLVTAVAAEKLLKGEVEKIVVTRPTVETGGRGLGYLPGLLEEKMLPYMVPLYEALGDHIGVAATQKLITSNKLQVVPLEFARGRTFNRSFVILDECQNATVEQARMFVTRMGYESFFAINGDLSQSDLVPPRDAGKDWENGLSYLCRKLAGRDQNIGYVEFQNRDVVRSDMVRRVLSLLDDQLPSSNLNEAAA